MARRLKYDPDEIALAINNASAVARNVLTDKPTVIKSGLTDEQLEELADEIHEKVQDTLIADFNRMTDEAKLRKANKKPKKTKK